jgi:hypothetical protein
MILSQIDCVSILPRVGTGLGYIDFRFGSGARTTPAGKDDARIRGVGRNEMVVTKLVTQDVRVKNMDLEKARERERER